jgi:glycosyltransferase involved in cell wall biosynthesis
MTASLRKPDVPLRVLIAAPVHMVGGQAHAARAIAAGFEGDPEIRATLQPIDPRLGGRLSLLTDTKILRSIIRPLLYLRQLWTAARKSEVLHVFGAAHTAFFFGAVPAIVVGRLLGRPVLLNYHDGRASEHFRLWGPLLRWLLRRVDLIVVPSGYLQEEFARHGFESLVVPNVVDTHAFSFHESSAIPQRLIGLRALEPLYAVENSVLAFSILKPAYPRLVLDVYGSGPEEPSLRALARQLRLEDVHFHGTIEHARMPEVLAPGGIVVNSSRVDNQPLFVLEAFASGVPVVSTAAGGIPWMIRDGENGLLAQVDDPPALAHQVRRLLENPALSRSIVAAGRKDLERYTWPVVREQWVEIYRSVERRRAT